MDIAHDFIADALGWDRGNIFGNIVIIYTVLAVGGCFFYYSFATFSYYYFFVLKKSRFFPTTIEEKELPAQMIHEKYIALMSIPLMAVPMLPAALFSYRGYSKIYKDVNEYGWCYLILSVPMFFLFTDCMVYWFHRGLHHPIFYRRLHKLHHSYRFTSPYSSHAFHPLDGFGQGIAYYVFPYIFPLHNLLFIGMFVLVNFWTISIHDQVDFGGHLVNTTGHHTIHHDKFNYNYGQYFTLWDRIGGTYKVAEQTHDLWGHDELVPAYQAHHPKKE